MLNHDSKSIVSEITRILYEEWDPCGVNDVPGCSDEYAFYARKILQLLRDGADRVQLMQHLACIQSEAMGNWAQRYEQERGRTADKLIALRESWAE